MPASWSGSARPSSGVPAAAADAAGGARSSPSAGRAGRISGRGRPWIGVTTQEAHGSLMVAAVTPGGPAQRAGLQRGDVIVGVGGAAPKDMADFYRKLYAQGAAGVTIRLDVQRDDQPQRFDVKSMNRLDH